MSDPPSGTTDSLAQRPVPAATGNRLGIAHLLLWITMTAAVFGFLQRHAPPSEEQASTGNARFDQRLRRRREMQHGGFVSLLVFAPAYGATLAALALTGWRIVRRRFDFPAQPGHWLLLVIAVIPVTVCCVSVLNSPFSEFVVFCSAMLYVTIMSAVAAVQTRKPRLWRWVFILAAVSLFIMWVEFVLNALVRDVLGPGLFAVLGMLILISSLLMALGCSFLDLTSAKGYDVFHWTGVGVLFATLGHAFVLWGINVTYHV